MTDVRRKDLARLETLDGREVKGVVEEVREEIQGHKRVVIRQLGDGQEIDTAADRVEVAA